MEPRFKFENINRRNNFEKNSKEGFGRLFSVLADKVNCEFCNPGEKKLVLDNGRINMEVFENYDPASDPEEIFNMEMVHSQMYYEEKDKNGKRQYKKDEEMIKYRLAEAGLPEGTPYAKILECWKKKKEEELSFKWEKTSTILLSRVLGNDFIVLRSSELDDYINKTDTVIVDKESGAVICAIDLVNDRAGGNRYEKKLQQLKKDVRGGQGGQLRFGITVEKDEKTGEKKLIKKELKNIPRFFLPTEENDLRRLLKEMSDDFNAPLIEIEKIIFGKLVNSLEEQKVIYAQSSKQSNISELFKLNLKKFESSLEKMKEVRNKF